jgi:hypothetical protein
MTSEPMQKTPARQAAKPRRSGEETVALPWPKRPRKGESPFRSRIRRPVGVFAHLRETDLRTHGLVPPGRGSQVRSVQVPESVKSVSNLRR